MHVRSTEFSAQHLPKLSLFDIDKDGELTMSKKKDKLHRAVSQLLYLATRASIRHTKVGNSPRQV